MREEVEFISVAQMKRPKLLEFAQWMASSQDNFLRAYESMPQPTDKNVAMTMHQWAAYGFQSVVMPDTYAAALMCTDAEAALEGQSLPWPAFEIRVPPATLYSSAGEVSSVWALNIPSWVGRAGKYKHHNLALAYLDKQSWGVNSFESLRSMFHAEEKARAGLAELGIFPPDLKASFDGDMERRLWMMITRLVAGVVLAINTARSERADAFPFREPRVKHGAPKVNTAQLGQALRIDCRPSVRSYVCDGKARGPQTVQTLVRGHWREQAYGEKWSKHRTTWIQPFFRGDGPLLTRPTKLGHEEPV